MLRRKELEECPGCGLRLPRADGPTHSYIGASAACWARYGRAYGDPARREVLQLEVAAYACQHPGEPGRRSAQSVGVHLMTLCMVLAPGAEPREDPKLHKRMVDRPAFTWLELVLIGLGLRLATERRQRAARPVADSSSLGILLPCRSTSRTRRPTVSLASWPA